MCEAAQSTRLSSKDEYEAVFGASVPAGKRSAFGEMHCKESLLGSDKDFNVGVAEKQRRKALIETNGHKSVRKTLGVI
jgi:hypothetical protein